MSQKSPFLSLAVALLAISCMITTAPPPEAATAKSRDHDHLSYFESALNSLRIPPLRSRNHYSAAREEAIGGGSGSSAAREEAIGGGAESSDEIISAARRPHFVDWVKSLRRRIHANPELAFDERETSRLIRRELDGLDVGYRFPLAKTGIRALIGSSPSEPTWMLSRSRALLDGFHKKKMFEGPENSPRRSSNPSEWQRAGLLAHLAAGKSTAASSRNPSSSSKTTSLAVLVTCSSRGRGDELCCWIVGDEFGGIRGRRLCPSTACIRI
ncbi:IAA-amino acid hydrolase ILR1-like 6 [Orobanche gracilis]